MRRLWSMVAALLVLATGYWAWRWKQDEPRRISLAALERLDAALRSGNSSRILESVAVSVALQSRTPAEQTEFLTKALRDEISPEGLAVLRREAVFGALTNVFPAEAAAWAKQAGVKPEDCVAFGLERYELRADVVLAQVEADRRSVRSFKIVRCNNVKQVTPQFHSAAGAQPWKRNTFTQIICAVSC